MRRLEVNKQIYYLSFIRVEEIAPDSLRYFVRLNSSDYIFEKSLNSLGCTQVGDVDELSGELLTEVRQAINAVERQYVSNPVMSSLNQVLFSIVYGRQLSASIS